MANKDIEVRRNEQAPGMMDLMPEFEDMVQNFFGPRFNSLFGELPMTNPRSMTNIQEDEKNYILCAEIPGIPQEDVEISINGNLLSMKAEHKEETSQKTGYRRQYRSFQQSFALPTTVDADKIEAHYENGVLEVVLPKTAQAQPKKIAIQSGQAGLRNQMNENNESSQSQKSQVQAKH